MSTEKTNDGRGGAAELLPVGTRIRFTRTLTESANEDHPSILFAMKGDLGTIIGHTSSEGYDVRTDGWRAWFGAKREEFEPVENLTRPTQ